MDYFTYLRNDNCKDEKNINKKRAQTRSRTDKDLIAVILDDAHAKTMPEIQQRLDECLALVQCDLLGLPPADKEEYKKAKRFLSACRNAMKGKFPLPGNVPFGGSWEPHILRNRYVAAVLEISKIQAALPQKPKTIRFRRFIENVVPRRLPNMRPQDQLAEINRIEEKLIDAVSSTERAKKTAHTWIGLTYGYSIEDTVPKKLAPLREINPIITRRLEKRKKHLAKEGKTLAQMTDREMDKLRYEIMKEANL
jgi:hypothetical protein